jgi:hypothetical protein
MTVAASRPRRTGEVPRRASGASPCAQSSWGGILPFNKVQKRAEDVWLQLDDVLFSFSYSGMATGRQFDLPYMVEQWDDTDSHVEELIALIGDFRVARAAYEEAVKRRPGRIVTLRQKTRVLADSRREPH